MLLVLMMGVLWCFPPSLDQVPPPQHQRSLPLPPPEEKPEASLFDPFPFPETLTPQVKFWKHIFTRYTTKHVVIHDSWYMDVVYEVVALDSPEFASEKEGWKAVQTAQKKYTQLLKAMSGKWEIPGKMTATERQVYDLFSKVPESTRFKKKDAKNRVRAQVGQADRFRDGLIRAGMHLDTMKQIMADTGLPETLVYLPLIESAFNPSARSPVGAAGIWQFMPGTGKQYKLTINGLVDERRDQLRATHAAAQLLAHNYEVTQSWPLAITAYNHGLQGIKNAVKKVGTDDIGVIVEQYDGSRFGFASRNFYPEFLAALDVCLRYTEYFGEIELNKPLALTQVKLPDYVSAKTLEKYTALTTSDIKKLNPALNSSVFASGNFLPRNYQLNMLSEQKKAFETAYAAIPKSLKYTYLAVKTKHKVKKGETLSAIAHRYRTTVSAIARLNNITNPRKIRAGQWLKIPGGYVASTQKTSSTPQQKTSSSGSSSQTPSVHRVQKGQTLTAIAKRYNTTAQALAHLNSIKNPRTIKPGQTLKIPAKTSSSTQTSSSSSATTSASAVHRVRKGQTLIAIARQYNTTAQAIASLNNIKNPRTIKPGQLLKIPKG